MFFGYGPQIDEIEDALKELKSNQESEITALETEIQQIKKAADEQLRQAKSHIRDMVILGDDENYAKLGKTIREAGATYNFPELIAGWRDEDTANRAEKEKLVQTHGSQADVRARMAALKGEIDVINEALGEMGPEIEAFDEATGKIAAHNEKYPKLAISEGMHDSYEDFSFWRWLGYYTFINRAPHSAYLAIGDYTAQYGDYYEDARDIAKLRANESEQQQVLADLTEKFNAESAIDNHMSHLDRAYKGPEGIGREIRERILNFMRTDDDYADILFDRSKMPAARAAALCLAKIDVLEKLHRTVAPYLKNAKETRDDLESPLRKINSVPFAVENDRVDFDLDRLVREVSNAADETNQAQQDAEKARLEIIGFEPRGHETYHDVKRALDKALDMGYHDNALSLNFIDLNNKIGRAVDRYEDEQRRKREAERAAAQARREALRDSFDTASKVRTRRESRSFAPAATTRTRTRTTSVSAGTKGISGSRGRRR